ncbi:GrpB family protein [Taibaiella koreensis]|uniref:GrpB family protein n=1 Tax=Taibaiella koreensis TaxID=1268548 RepID=UPI000E59DB7A|nr:GrpB family protein [Taibaiella koreensis]
MEAINIMDYDPRWPEQFEQLKSIYSAALENHILSVEHVGSTAVPGLAAKPVLDIDIIVADEARLNKTIPIIALMGYQFMGDQGIKDRYAFRAVSDLSPDMHTGVRWPKHHLYCGIAGSISLSNHLLFRDALRGNVTLAEQYGELKKNLASATGDIDVYVEGKSAFIADVLQKAGLSGNHIQDIIAQNKKK